MFHDLKLYIFVGVVRGDFGYFKVGTPNERLPNQVKMWYEIPYPPKSYGDWFYYFSFPKTTLESLKKMK